MEWCIFVYDVFGCIGQVGLFGVCIVWGWVVQYVCVFDQFDNCFVVVIVIDWVVVEVVQDYEVCVLCQVVVLVVVVVQLGFVVG